MVAHKHFCFCTHKKWRSIHKYNVFLIISEYKNGGRYVIGICYNTDSALLKYPIDAKSLQKSINYTYQRKGKLEENA